MPSVVDGRNTCSDAFLLLCLFCCLFVCSVRSLGKEFFQLIIGELFDRTHGRSGRLLGVKASIICACLLTARRTSFARSSSAPSSTREDSASSNWEHTERRVAIGAEGEPTADIVSAKPLGARSIGTVAPARSPLSTHRCLAYRTEVSFLP